MSLYLLSFRPNFPRLMALAARERLLPPGGDAGYLLHAVFAACFGALAPAPFRLLAPGEPGGGPSGRLLAYASVPLAELSAHADAFADPSFAAPLALAEAADKRMPTDFAAGARLGFSVRIRPVQRTGAPRAGAAAGSGPARGRERDIYLAACAARDPAAPPPDPVRLYGDWLARQLAPAAGIEHSTVEALRRTRLCLRDRSGAQAALRTVEGPDAIFSGTLTVREPAAFAALLSRGVGRARAFGFGMLLLRPPT